MHFNKIVTRAVLTIFCLPCMLVKGCQKLHKAHDKSSDEEKASKQDAIDVAKLNEKLQNVGLGTLFYRKALEQLFYVHLYETYRQTNFFGTQVQAAFAKSSGDPASGTLLMAETIDLEINTHIQGLFKTAYQEGSLDLCAICSDSVGWQGCFTYYVGYVSRQNESYVGSTSEVWNFDWSHPDDNVAECFEQVKHHVRNVSFRNELALMLKQATLRAASLDLNAFSEKSGVARPYNAAQIEPYLDSWIKHQYAMLGIDVSK